MTETEKVAHLELLVANLTREISTLKRQVAEKQTILLGYGHGQPRHVYAGSNEMVCRHRGR